jgi:hypothetical protein
LVWVWRWVVFDFVHCIRWLIRAEKLFAHTHVNRFVPVEKPERTCFDWPKSEKDDWFEEKHGRLRYIRLQNTTT